MQFNQMPTLNIDRRHVAHTRCDNEQCPSQNECRRFQGYAYENLLTVFYAAPLEITNGKCNMFIDNTSKEAKEFFPPNQ